MIGVIDYGLGNVQAFLDSFTRIDRQAIAVSTPTQIEACDRLVLPGVGAFDLAMERLRLSNLVPSIEAARLSNNIPILGVCVGLQIFFPSSSEGKQPGLGWLEGQVERLADQHGERIRLPHMGWNSVEHTDDCWLFSGIKTPRFYFLHSYFVDPSPSVNAIGWTTYGSKFASAVERDRLVGVQFHPEKSHRAGLQLLENFAQS